MPETLLRDASHWVRKYREPVPKPEVEIPAWPITKEQMGKIMGCSVEACPTASWTTSPAASPTVRWTSWRWSISWASAAMSQAGLRYPVEIHDGSNYEGRTDLGNTQPGDGIKFAGTGWLQVTGRANHQGFADYMASIGQPDPKIMEIGKTYSSERYPWSMAGNWWRNAGMKAMCEARKECTNYQIDEIGARVNGRV